MSSMVGQPLVLGSGSSFLRPYLYVLSKLLHLCKWICFLTHLVMMG